MKNIFIDATAITPKIVLDAANGEFSIVGKSYPEDGIAYYKFMVEYLEGIKKLDVAYFQLKFDIEYANTSSVKAFVYVIHKMQELLTANKQASVLWVYEQDDEEMLELGKDIDSLTQVPFKFLAKKNK